MGQRKIRQSQTIVPFGVGAIFDYQGESLVGCDAFLWGRRGETIVSDRLANVLGVRTFRAAPASESNRWGNAAAWGVPYSRFPTWLFCQHCRRMTRWNRSLEQEGKVPTCAVCPGKRQLVPMRWVQICPHGHMDDIDWKRWAHSQNDSGDARQCQSDQLFFETVKNKGGGGLDTLQVRCKACSSWRNLMGITAKGSLKSIGVTCAGRQPWQRWSDRQDCLEVPLATQRGASNVYYPLVHSSIEIPNPSRADASDDKALEIKADSWFDILMKYEEGSPQAEMAVESLCGVHSVSKDYVRALARDERQRAAGKATAVEATPGDLLSEEWAAFLTEMNGDDPNFRTRHVALGVVSTDAEALLDDRIDKVVLADRIREVRALEGFHRVTPGGKDTLVKAGLHRSLPWLPAIEVRGEGIFLSIDEGRLSVWEQREAVRDRVAELDRRLERSFMVQRLRERTGPILQARYVLLHTFAHLLIRRLAFESGYAATSLRERIYARSSGQHEGVSKQAGLLVYTAAGDAEGTLGGLARQGEPPSLQTTILEALQGAMWCSSDPLCSENQASTFDSLNLAACHACTLVAETSCECGNYLLDRALVIGNEREGLDGFFQPVLDAAVEAAGEGVRGL